MVVLRTIAASAALALVACSTDYTAQLQPADAGATRADASADGGITPDAPKPTLPTLGRIVTVARNPSDGGTVMLADDGFESASVQCNGALCVTGGLVP